MRIFPSPLRTFGRYGEDERLGNFVATVVILSALAVAILSVIWGIVGSAGMLPAQGIVSAQAQKPAEKPPVPQRSLEKIDNIGGFGDPNVYLYRALSCYYILVVNNGRTTLAHVESCPAPVHQKVWSFGTGSPNGTRFGGVLPNGKTFGGGLRDSIIPEDPQTRKN